MTFTDRLIQTRFSTCLVILLPALLLAACSSGSGYTNLASSATEIPQTQGVVVIGVQGDAQATFRPGVLANDGSFEHESRTAEFRSADSEPYIVQALEQTTTTLRYGMFSASLGGKRYEFECGQVLPVLSVQPGAAQYYGDFEVLVDDGKLKVKQSFDIERAQQFIDSNYPDSGWKLLPGKLDRARSTECLTVPPAAIVS